MSMKPEEYANIRHIEFPNTAMAHTEVTVLGATMEKWRFEPSSENGEMASIPYVDVYRNDKKIAHIRLSVCNVYFK